MRRNPQSHALSSQALVALVLGQLVVWTGCAPDRSQWMEQAASQQAQIATGGIGSQQEVRTQARQGAGLLRGLSAMMLKNPQISSHVATAFQADCTQLSSGLDAIADSQSDEQFTAAVFSMCDPQRRAAASRVGQLMTGMATQIRAHPPANVPDAEVAHWENYFDTFGERLVNIPSQCDHASQAMAEADTQERKAEVEHQANVNAAMTATAVVLGTAILAAGAVAAAEASRPIIVQNPPPAPVGPVYTNCTDYGGGSIHCVSQ